MADRVVKMLVLHEVHVRVESVETDDAIQAALEASPGPGNEIVYLRVEEENGRTVQNWQLAPWITPALLARDHALRRAEHIRVD